jgi:hypothetical protein
VDGRASRGPRRAVGAARQSTAEDLGRPAQAGYGVRCVRQFAERALVLRGAWRAIFDIPKSDQLTGPDFSTYPYSASWRVRPVGDPPWAAPLQCPASRLWPAHWASAGAGRAVFDTPKIFDIPNFDQLVARGFRHTQIWPVGKSDQLVHPSYQPGTPAPVGLLPFVNSFTIPRRGFGTL